MRFPHKISEHEKFATFFTYIFQFIMLFAFQLQLCIESFASYKKNIYVFPFGCSCFAFLYSHTEYSHSEFNSPPQDH